MREFRTVHATSLECLCSGPLLRFTARQIRLSKCGGGGGGAHLLSVAGGRMVTCSAQGGSKGWKMGGSLAIHVFRSGVKINLVEFEVVWEAELLASSTERGVWNERIGTKPLTFKIFSNVM